MEKVGAFTDRTTSEGEWRSGDPASNVRATPMLAAYFNMLQKELCNVVTGAGLGLDQLNNGQLLEAIQAMIGAAGYLPRLSAIPEEHVADEIYVSGYGELIWVETSFFVGYRGPYCGRPAFGHTSVPLPREVDAVGGLLPKAEYAGLWGYAQEENLVYSDAVWSANIGSHWFADVSGTHFRVPDLRNQFLRFTGTDADTANARLLGTYQSPSLGSHSHQLTLQRSTGGESSSMPTVNNGNNTYPFNANGQPSLYVIRYDNTDAVGASGGTETRGPNTAFNPRMCL